MKTEKNGGRPKKETIGFENKKTIGFQKEETKTKPNENVNENVNVNENDNVNVNAIDFYNNNINLLTPYEFEKLQEYADMEEELIIFAMQKAVTANVRNFNYIEGILKNWKGKGIKTLLQAKNEEIEFKQAKQKKEESEEEKKARKVRELEALMNGNK
jgi:DnaD/phage-associated family protein